MDEAAKAVKDAMAAVTIQDYSFLQNLSLAGDGHPLGEYIVDLFGASLSYRFRDSPELKEARALADKTPFKKHLPLSMVPSHLIFELYREVLTEPLVEEKIVEHPWCSEKTLSVIEEAPEATAPTFAGGEALAKPIQPQATECVLAINVTDKEFIDSAPQAPPTKQSALDQRDKAGPTHIAVPEVAIPPLPETEAPNVLPTDANAIAWLSTGDIFAKDAKEPLLMVLNAGCDLQFAPNSKRNPQHDRSILLIEGTVYQISNLQPPNEIARTEFFKFGETLCRINWTDRVRTIKHVDFKRAMEKGGYEKRVARLSLPYVLQVQQAWLASLGRVGVPVAPPHSVSSDIEIYVSVEKVPVLKKRVSHGATIFRVKQKEGYVSEFLLSKDTVTAVRQFLQELERHRGQSRVLTQFNEGDAIHFLYLVVRAEDLRVLEEFPSLCAAGFRVLSGSPELLEQLKGLVHEVAAERPWREAVCQARLDLLGYELARQMEKGPRPSGNGKTLHPAALRAMDLLRTSLGYSWTLPELSARAGLSVPHLCAVFKREYAQTPMRALQKLRVEEALRRLRETDQSITDLAMDLGFASSQHFSREFRRHTGHSAREVRQAGR